MPALAPIPAREGGLVNQAHPNLSAIIGPSTSRAALPRPMIVVTGSTVPASLLRRHINAVLRKFPEAVTRYGLQPVARAVTQALHSLNETVGECVPGQERESPDAAGSWKWQECVRFWLVPDSQPSAFPDNVETSIAVRLQSRTGGVGARLIASVMAPHTAPLDLPHPGVVPRVIRTPIPEQLAQQTSQMMRTVNAALGDASTLYRWQIVEGKMALMHVIPGWGMQTILEPKQALSWWGCPDTVDALQAELRQIGIEAVFLANVLTGLCLQENQVTIALDDLVRIVGRGDEARRSYEHRIRVEREVWRAVRIFDALTLVGRPLGHYRTIDKEVLNVALPSAEALIKITRVVPGQVSSDGSTPPAFFSYVCGPWFYEMRSNPQLMTYLGNVMRLAAIPSGKPKGAWAKSIGLNLNQRWREWAHEAKVGHVGDANRITVRFNKHSTRRDLLLGESLYRASPDAQGVLDSHNPARAREFWDGAISILKESGVDLIGHCAPVAPGPMTRQGWQDEWLDQPLDIRPTQQSMRAVAELAQANAQATRRRARQGKGRDKAA